MNISMSEIQIKELFIAKEDGRSTIRILASSPTPLEEKNLGRLFAVMEIDSQDTINDNILDIIANEIHAQYYRSESFEMETAFENALQKTNQKLQELISEIGEEWLHSMNIVLGVQKGKALVFTNIGRVIAMMVHNGKIIDVLDSAKTKAQDINPLKIFNNIVAGEASDNSALIFATETILDYLSKEKIKRILEEKKPDEAVEELYHLLEEDTTNTNFAALLIKAEGMREQISQNGEIPVINKPAPVQRSINGEDSMSNLLGKQNQTEELLSTSLWPKVKKSLRQYIGNIGKKNDTASVEKDEQQVKFSSQTANAASTRTIKISGNIAQKIISALKYIIVALGGSIRSLMSRTRSSQIKGFSTNKKSYPKRNQRSGKGSASKGLAGLIQRFKALTLTQKIFFIVAIVVLLIFAQLVVNRGEENITKEQESSYSQTIGDIDLKINEGKAAALYDNETARGIFLEAKTMLESIPTESEIYKERGEELSGILSAQLRQVNNIITLENPSPKLDFSGINPKIEISNVILLGASVYGFDKNNKSVYRGNLENQDTTVTISDSSSENTFAQAAKASPGTGVTILSDQTFELFNPVAETLTPLNLQYANTDHNFTDLSVFGIRLYTLDTKNNQIFRHRKTNEEFGTGEPWVTDGTKLDNAISLSIDGEIYILRNNGTVTKLNAGTNDSSFTLAEIDPKLDTAQTIYTDENTENLYILDALNQRVVVFTKEGSLVAQYTSSAFNSLSDMIVDEANNKIYVLNSTKLYEIDLQ